MDDNEQRVAESAPSTDRLDSWKEIAAHLERGVSTVQRWEKQEGPVHRHLHNKLDSVWAQRSEIDAWWRERQAQLERQPESRVLRLKVLGDEDEGAARGHGGGEEVRSCRATAWGGPRCGGACA